MYKFCLLRAAEQSASPEAALQRDTQEKIRLRSATKIWKPKKEPFIAGVLRHEPAVHAA